MLIKTEIKTTNIDQIHSSALELKFNVPWTLDDNQKIVEHILQTTGATTLEVIKGADLYCLRIKYNSYEFLLNFEEYSHACWIECITEQDRPGLLTIKKLLAEGAQNYNH